MFFFWKIVVYLQRVFHSIRFKVNKGWVSAETLFYFYPIVFSLAMTVVALAPSCSSDDGLAGSIEFIDCGSDAAIRFFLSRQVVPHG